MKRSVLLCPSCKTAVPIAEALRPEAFPFCSKRCKMADLGRWFGEEYVVPAPVDPDDHESIEKILQARHGEG